jgi:diaminohydroxyphosphoribosylaminopyrimidine deaminase / 5-amino-6-(5-phosphoribosylamino)uracil reductase
MKEKELYMRRCLELAQRGKGQVAPNPMVGAVLVYKDRRIGEGWHERYGEAHAEVRCLESVADEDKHLISESTMYVSLEPCAHFGKTPPCAVRLAEEKVKEVIVCNDDPFEKVQGKGFDLLHTAGIKTETGVLMDEGRWVNRRFFCFHQQKRPYIILKWAQTEQSYFASSDGSRLQMSNRHSQQLVHKWRTEEAAILVGTKTAIADDPQLTARLWEGRQPLRIVIDRRLEVPATHMIFGSEARTWIVNEKEDKAEGQTRLIRMSFEGNVIEQLMERLHEEQITSLIVEGGAKLLNSFIESGLWDEARVFITPNILKEGVPAPLLTNSDKAFESDIAGDTLKVYVQRESKYKYENGMEL